MQYLEKNKIGDMGGESLANNILLLQKLENLNLSSSFVYILNIGHNNIRERGRKALIEVNKQLAKLNISLFAQGIYTHINTHNYILTYIGWT